MADTDDPATLDDVTSRELQEDYVATLTDTLDGWEPSPAAVEVAIGAAVAEEGAELYGLVQQDAEDASRDYGANVEGIRPDEAYPASSSTTWTAGDTIGHTILAGTILAIDDGPDLEVLQDATIGPGDTTVTGVIVQAIEPGAVWNGASGDLSLDDPPPWLTSVELDAALDGGADAESDEDYRQKLARTRYAHTDALVTPEHIETAAMNIPGIARCLVVKGYNLLTTTPDVPLHSTAYPIQADGSDAAPTATTLLAAEFEARSPGGVKIHIGTPTRTDVDVDVTIAAFADVDPTYLEDTVNAVLAELLSGATWGDPREEQGRRWRATWRTVHRYQVSAAIAAIKGVEYVDDLVLNSTPDTDVTLSGIAPLPRLDAVTVTIIDPV